MATPDYILERVHDLAANHWRAAPHHQWWKYAAVNALRSHRAQIIPGRDGRSPYLLRCWLSEPVRSSTPGSEHFESGDSLLLHHFFAPDDDGALHDHPWDFTTTILAGSYVERRPAQAVGITGPERIADMFRSAGERLTRRATDLHSIVEVGPDTWTLVQTSARTRDWCFHPAGQMAVPWREYLAQQGKRLAPVVGGAT